MGREVVGEAERVGEYGGVSIYGLPYSALPPVNLARDDF